MFFGRKREIEQLHKLHSSSLDKPNIAILYGRRRVGKTALIKEAFKDERVLFFEGIEGQPKDKQLANFVFQLQQQIPSFSCESSPKNWSEALILLRPIISKEKNKQYVIVFDEFQWMASYKESLVSELKMIWDQYLSEIKGTTLVLCGSIASFMINKVVKSNALYGRIQLEINLAPFKLFESKQLLNKQGNVEVLESMLILGGIPLYLNMVKDYPSLYLAINDLAFRPNAYFTNEFDKIFISHFGKKDYYSKVIKALGKNAYGLFREEISTICDIELSGNLSNCLSNLESAGFIKSFYPFDKEGNSKIKKYVLTDPYINFYLQFIGPNKKNISPEKKDIFLKITQTTKFLSFLGRSFELFCQNHSYTISSLLGFSGIEYSVGPFFRKALHEKGVQIDLLFDRQDNVITLCEMKYSQNPVGIAVIKEVELKVKEIQKISKKTIQKVLIVKDEVSKDLLQSGYFYRIIRSDEFFMSFSK